MPTLTVAAPVDGDLTVTTDTEEFSIDSFVVDGIVRSLVQGRDLEDGLAPLIVLADIIVTKLGLEERDLPMSAPPEWLTCWENHPEPATPEQQAEFNDNYEITPLIMLLAGLVRFGGEQDPATGTLSW